MYWDIWTWSFLFLIGTRISMASMFKKDKSKIRVINRCQYVITLLPLGFFGVRIPGGITKCLPLYNSRTKYGNSMKLCRPIVWPFVHILKKSLLWPQPLWLHTCSFFKGTTSKTDYFLKNWHIIDFFKEILGHILMKASILILWTYKSWKPTNIQHDLITSSFFRN